MTDAIWTLEELGDHVGHALTAAGYEAPANGQVRAVPDARTIRYYTTLGLIARPTLRGRTALYGRRHLQQIVAIKQLQAQGLSLGAIQQQLVGAGDAELERLAAVPPDVGTPTASSGPAARPAGPGPVAERRRGRFWQAAPAAPSSALPEQAAPPDCAASSGVGVGVGDAEAGEPMLLAALPLGRGATLLFPPGRAIADRDRARIVRAAAALLEELEASGLLSPQSPASGPQVSRASTHSQKGEPR